MVLTGRVGVYMTFAVVVSGDRGNADWSFLLVLLTTYYSAFSFCAITEAVGKDFSGNRGREMEPTRGFTTPIMI